MDRDALESESLRFSGLVRPTVFLVGWYHLGSRIGRPFGKPGRTSPNGACRSLKRASLRRWEFAEPWRGDGR